MNWRLNDEKEGNICVMNEYSKSTGAFIPKKYVHVKCINTSENDIALHCSCDMYSYIQMSSHQEVPLRPEDEPYLDQGLTCMHCRFYKDHLVNAYDNICNSTTLTRSLAIVKESLQHMNQPVQLLGMS